MGCEEHKEVIMELSVSYGLWDGSYRGVNLQDESSLESL